jgi:ADP-heptose:LPS heptosyltransferase
MGLGGFLMWTAVARELNERTRRKVVPCQLVNDTFHVVGSEIFQNNPRFVSDSSGIPLILNDPRTNYCKLDTPERAVHRYDRHVIEQICEIYGIKDPKLQCELFFTAAENHRVGELAQRIKFPFVVIEPNVKNEYGVNKEYPFEKWQQIVNAISPAGHQIVQVGVKGSRVLSGVYNLTGQTTFRETALLISLSRLLVASEGGLMHAANAVSTPAVIVVTGFLHPKMTCYPENDNIWIGSAHGPCGMKVLCQACHEEARVHDWTEISNAILQRLS